MANTTWLYTIVRKRLFDSPSASTYSPGDSNQADLIVDRRVGVCQAFVTSLSPEEIDALASYLSFLGQSAKGMSPRRCGKRPMDGDRNKSCDHAGAALFRRPAASRKNIGAG